MRKPHSGWDGDLDRNSLGIAVKDNNAHAAAGLRVTAFGSVRGVPGRGVVAFLGGLFAGYAVVVFPIEADVVVDAKAAAGHAPGPGDEVQGSMDGEAVHTASELLLGFGNGRRVVSAPPAYSGTSQPSR